MITSEYAPGRRALVHGEPDRGIALLWHGRGVDSADWMLPLTERVASGGVLAVAADWSSETADGGRSDLLSSLRFTRQLAEQRDLDPDAVVVAGWSLGGTAAASLAVHAKRLGVDLGGVVLIAPGDGPRAVDGITGAPLPATMPPGEGRCRIDVLYGDRDTSATPDLVSGLELRLRSAGWSTTLQTVDADHGEIVGCRYDARREAYRRSTQPRALAAAELVAGVIVRAVTSSS
jgi:pimeloyl-ACP methyl ester carboxylesterase